MAFCPNCGSQADGEFCGNCGTRVTGGAASSGSASYGSGFQSPAVSAPGLTDNVAGALCYLFTVITGIIFLVIAPYNQNKLIRFHAFQSILFFVAYIVVSIVLGMLSIVTHGLMILLWPLVHLFFIGVWLYMMYTAYSNKKIKLPIIGDLAEKQA